MRVGEVCGLTWNDIDFDKGIIYVRRIVERIKLDDGKSKAMILEPKTKIKKKNTNVKRIITKIKKYVKIL